MSMEIHCYIVFTVKIRTMQFMWKLWADVWDLMDFISAQSQASCGDMCDCIAYMQE